MKPQKTAQMPKSSTKPPDPRITKQNLTTNGHKSPVVTSETKSTTSKTQLQSEFNNTRIFARLKPLPRPEKCTKEPTSIYQVQSPQVFINLRDCPQDMSKNVNVIGKRFVYSEAFGVDVSQMCIFDKAVRPLVEKFLDGENCVIMCYGPTQSGRTYTLEGSPTNLGSIPRSLDLIFSIEKPEDIPSFCPRSASTIQILDEADHNACVNLKKKILSVSDEKLVKKTIKTPYDKAFEKLSGIKRMRVDHTDLWVSYAEIRDEIYYDLLALDYVTGRKPLRIDIDDEDNAFIDGLSYVAVSSVAEALGVLHFGRTNLEVLCGDKNFSSSRSHCIFSIVLIRYDEPGQPESVQMSRLSFCDLAAQDTSEIDLSLISLTKSLKANHELHNRSFQKSGEFFCLSQLTRLFSSALNGHEPLSFITHINQEISAYKENHAALHFTALISETMTEIRKINCYKPSTSFGLAMLNEAPELCGHVELSPQRLVALSDSFQSEIAALRAVSMRYDIKCREKTIHKYSAMINRIDGDFKRKLKTLEAQKCTTLSKNKRQRIDEETAAEHAHREALDSIIQRLRTQKQVLERELMAMREQLTQMIENDIQQQHMYIVDTDATATTALDNVAALGEAREHIRTLEVALTAAKEEYINLLAENKDKEKKIGEVERKYVAVKLDRESELLVRKTTNWALQRVLEIADRKEELLRRVYGEFRKLSQEKLGKSGDRQVDGQVGGRDDNTSEETQSKVYSSEETLSNSEGEELKQDECLEDKVQDSDVQGVIVEVNSEKQNEKINDCSEIVPMEIDTSFEVDKAKETISLNVDNQSQEMEMCDFPHEKSTLASTTVSNDVKTNSDIENVISSDSGEKVINSAVPEPKTIEMYIQADSKAGKVNSVDSNGKINSSCGKKYFRGVVISDCSDDDDGPGTGSITVSGGYEWNSNIQNMSLTDSGEKISSSTVPETIVTHSTLTPMEIQGDSDENQMDSIDYQGKIINSVIDDKINNAELQAAELAPTLTSMPGDALKNSELMHELPPMLINTPSVCKNRRVTELSNEQITKIANIEVINPKSPQKVRLLKLEESIMATELPELSAKTVESALNDDMIMNNPNLDNQSIEETMNDLRRQSNTPDILDQLNSELSRRGCNSSSDCQNQSDDESALDKQKSLEIIDKIDAQSEESDKFSVKPKIIRSTRIKGRISIRSVSRNQSEPRIIQNVPFESMSPVKSAHQKKTGSAMKIGQIQPIKSGKIVYTTGPVAELLRKAQGIDQNQGIRGAELKKINQSTCDSTDNVEIKEPGRIQGAAAQNQTESNLIQGNAKAKIIHRSQLPSILRKGSRLRRSASVEQTGPQSVIETQQIKEPEQDENQAVSKPNRLSLNSFILEQVEAIANVKKDQEVMTASVLKITESGNDSENNVPSSEINVKPDNSVIINAEDQIKQVPPPKIIQQCHSPDDDSSMKDEQDIKPAGSGELKTESMESTSKIDQQSHHVSASAAQELKPEQVKDDEPAPVINVPSSTEPGVIHSSSSTIPILPEAPVEEQLPSVTSKVPEIIVTPPELQTPKNNQVPLTSSLEPQAGKAVENPVIISETIAFPSIGAEEIIVSAEAANDVPIGTPGTPAISDCSSDYRTPVGSDYGDKSRIEDIYQTPMTGTTPGTLDMSDNFGNYGPSGTPIIDVDSPDLKISPGKSRTSSVPGGKVKIEPQVDSPSTSTRRARRARERSVEKPLESTQEHGVGPGNSAKSETPSVPETTVEIEDVSPKNSRRIRRAWERSRGSHSEVTGEPEYSGVSPTTTKSHKNPANLTEKMENWSQNGGATAGNSKNQENRELLDTDGIFIDLTKNDGPTTRTRRNLRKSRRISESSVKSMENLSNNTEDSENSESLSDISENSTPDCSKNDGTPTSLRRSNRKRRQPAMLYQSPVRPRKQRKKGEGELYHICDNCDVHIIEGYRYHCNLCGNGDFDLCYKCFQSLGHQHQVELLMVV